MADLKNIAETLVNLTVKEVNELATILKDEYGIEPAAAAAVMVAGGAGAGGVSGVHGPVHLGAGEHAARGRPRGPAASPRQG